MKLPHHWALQHAETGACSALQHQFHNPATTAPVTRQAAVLQDGRDHGRTYLCWCGCVCVTSFSPWFGGSCPTALQNSDWMPQYLVPASSVRLLLASPRQVARPMLGSMVPSVSTLPIVPGYNGHVGWQHRAHLLSPVTTHHHHTSRHRCRLQAAGHASWPTFQTRYQEGKSDCLLQLCIASPSAANTIVTMSCLALAHADQMWPPPQIVYFLWHLNEDEENKRIKRILHNVM